MEKDKPSILVTGPNSKYRDAMISVCESLKEHQKLSKITILTLFIYGVTQFIGGLTNTILTPFYTKEATEKGIPVWQTGLVYGSMFLTNVVFSPIFGKYLGVLGSMRLFLFGNILAGVSHILFGFLEFVHDSTTFLALSFTIRIVSAIGESAFYAAIYYLTTKDAPENYKSTILSCMETVYGVGMSVGPFLGGILYEIQGFYLPFAICGGGLLICAMVTLVLTCYVNSPSNEELLRQSESSEESVQENTTYWQLIKMPGILLSCYLMIVARLTTSWYLPSLQPFLEEHFQLNATLVGVMFMIDGLSYAIFSPIGGLILDKTRNKHIHLLFASAVGTVVGFSMLGPAPFLSLPKSIYIVGLALVIQGAFVAITFITTLMYSLNTSLANGAADTEQTKGMVICLWFNSQYIACYLGTGVGGAAYDAFGFEYSTLFVIALQIIALLVIGVYYKTAMSIANVTDDETIIKTPIVLSRRGSVNPTALVLKANAAVMQCKCKSNAKRNSV